MCGNANMPLKYLIRKNLSNKQAIKVKLFILLRNKGGDTRLSDVSNAEDNVTNYQYTVP